MAPAAVGMDVAGLELHQIEENIIKETNAVREQHGMPPLAASRNLIESARRHTAWMTRNRTLQHASSAVAENIAMGQQSSKQVVDSWMSSPGHRANILNGSYTKIGVAAYRTPDGRIYWCQQFMW
jgi:uncharacterized protein YkwD